MYRPVDPELSIRDIYRALFRHKKKAGLFFLASVSAALLLTVCVSKMYRSEALLFLRLGRENVAIDTTATLGREPVVAVPTEREYELNSVVEMLSTRTLLEETVDRIGPEVILSGQLPAPADTSTATASLSPEPSSLKQLLTRVNLSDPLSPRDRAIIHLDKNFQVEATKRTSVLRLAMESTDPKLSQKILETIVDLYLSDHARLNRNPGAYKFLSQQADRVLAELRTTENELRQLKERTGLASPLEQRQLLVQRIARLEDELWQVDATLASTSAEVGELRETLVEQPSQRVTAKTNNVPNPSVDGMRQQLYTLQLRERELKSKYTDQHPEVRQIEEQIAQAQKILDQYSPTLVQTTSGPNRVFEETELSLVQREPVLAGSHARARSLRRQLTDVRKQLKQAIKDEVTIAALERRRELLDADYRRYASSLEQSRIDESLEAQRISNISIAQPPSLNLKPVSPKRLLNLGLGVAIGAFGALAIAFFSEKNDRSLQSAEQIERELELPTLATIPQMQATRMSGANGSL